MCLILIAYKMHESCSLVIAANRDEYYNRPTAPLSFWDDEPHILAGRDLKEKGTWLGITRNGRLAAVTNYRNPLQVIPNAASRGHLVRGFLESDESPYDYLATIQKNKSRYNGFNLIVGNHADIFYYSNRENGIQQLRQGIYGISNHLLDTPWHKVENGKTHLRQVLENGKINSEDLFTILEDRLQPPDDALPDTGVGIEWERILAPVFIRSEIYGTRSSSVIIADSTGNIYFAERSFAPEDGKRRTEDRVYSFRLSTKLQVWQNR